MHEGVPLSEILQYHQLCVDEDLAEFLMLRM